MKSTELICHKGKVYIRQTSYKGHVYIILMSSPSAIHILTAALNIKSNDPNRGAKAHAVVMKFSTSTYVTVPLGTTTAALADIAAFNAAIGAARKTTWNQVNSDLKNVMAIFSTAMRADPVHAEVICVSGGFKVKGVAIRQKNVYTLTQGVESGTLICLGDVFGNTIFHAWWISRNGVDWTLIMGTPEAENILTGLALGRVWIKHQCRTRGTHGPVKVLFLDLI